MPFTMSGDISFLLLLCQALVLALQKFKVSEELKKYSVDHPEPLLSFALSCGMHSSPAVRAYCLLIPSLINKYTLIFKREQKRG